MTRLKTNKLSCAWSKKAKNTSIKHQNQFYEVCRTNTAKDFKICIKHCSERVKVQLFSSHQFEKKVILYIIHILKNHTNIYLQSQFQPYKNRIKKFSLTNERCLNSATSYYGKILFQPTLSFLQED